MFTRSKTLPLLFAAALAFSACAKEEPAAVPAQRTSPAPTKEVAPPAKPEKRTVRAGESETIHGLAPKNTVLWLEIKSFDSLVQAFDELVGDSLDGLGGASDPKSALALLQLMGLPTHKLEMDQPLALALSLELGSKEPNFTLLLPMIDPQNTAKKIRATNEDLKVLARGRFVAISDSPSYRPDISLAAALRDVRGQGLIGMHVQTARLVDRFEMEVDMGLQAMLLQSSSDPKKSAAYKAGALIAVETVHALSKGLKDMSFKMDLVDGELTFEAAATLRAGSRLTEFGQDEASNLRDMLRYVNAGSDELVLGTAHKDSLRFIGDPLVAMYDKHAVAMETQGARDDFEQLLGMIVAESVDIAFTGNLAEYNTDMALFMNGVDSARWVAQAERWVESQLMGLENLTLMQPRKGQDEDSRFAQYDLVAQARSETAKELEHLLGSPRIRLRFLGHGDETMITLGEGSHFQNRSSEKQAPMASNLTWALERIGSASPAVISHVHANHGYLDKFGKRMIFGAESEDSPEAPTQEQTWVTSYMAFGTTEWRMGARLDVSAFGKSLKQASQLSGTAYAEVR